MLAIRVTDRIGKGIRGAPRDALIADSVDPAIRGRAFGFHRAADHAGAVVGPLLAFALLRWGGPGAPHSLPAHRHPRGPGRGALLFGVREVPRETPETIARSSTSGLPLGRRFWSFLGVLLVFTLGNSTDAFLLLRARDLGVDAALIPILWAMLHVVKSLSSTPGGALSDRSAASRCWSPAGSSTPRSTSRLARADAAWQAWALFAVYGIYFGLTEGVEKALVADLVPADRRGTAFGWYNLALGSARCRPRCSSARSGTAPGRPRPSASERPWRWRRRSASRSWPLCGRVEIEVMLQ